MRRVETWVTPATTTGMEGTRLGWSWNTDGNFNVTPELRRAEPTKMTRMAEESDEEMMKNCEEKAKEVFWKILGRSPRGVTAMSEVYGDEYRVWTEEYDDDNERTTTRPEKSCARREMRRDEADSYGETTGRSHRTVTVSATSKVHGDEHQRWTEEYDDNDKRMTREQRKTRSLRDVGLNECAQRRISVVRKRRAIAVWVVTNDARRDDSSEATATDPWREGGARFSRLQRWRQLRTAMSWMTVTAE